METFNTESRRDDIALDILDFLHFIQKKLPIIIVATLIFAVIGYALASSSAIAEYTSSTEVYILPFDTLEMTEAQFSTIFVNDCKAIISSNSVADAVIEKLGLDMNTSALTSSIEIVSQTNCRVLRINVTHSDPVVSASIANAIREEATAKIKATMDVKDVRIVSEAVAPEESPVSASKTTIVFVALAGFILAFGALIIVYLFDDSIRTEADVADCLGVRVLGAIPDSRAVAIGSAPRKN